MIFKSLYIFFCVFKLSENLLSLKFDNDEPLSALKLIITMLYWIPKVDVSLFRHLATLCHDKDTSWDLSVYILDVLNSRLVMRFLEL